MMLMTALIVLPLLLIGGVALTALQGRTNLAGTSIAQERALQAAEAAIDVSIFLANTDALVDDDSRSGTLGNGLTWALLADDMATDGENNDNDAFTDEFDERGFEVTVTGRYASVARRLVAYVRPLTPLPEVTAAVALQDPASVLDINGASFTLDGTDHNIDGSPGTAPMKYGVEINDPGTVAGLLSGLTAAQKSRITGTGGAPSANVGSFNYDDLFAALRPVAHNLYPGGMYLNVPNFGNAATNTWRVTYFTGNTQIGGNVDGAGLVLIDGDLWLSGNFNFVGLVLVRGNIRFTGGGSSKMIRGALMVGGDAALGDVFELSGTVDVHYSAAAVAAIRKLVEQRKVLAGWREIARS
jgi:hypothetical protein